MEDSDFEEARAAAPSRLASLERIQALCRLREQAKAANRAAMLESIEDMIAAERKVLARDLDDKPA
jgi:hypothetical protein